MLNSMPCDFPRNELWVVRVCFLCNERLLRGLCAYLHDNSVKLLDSKCFRNDKFSRTNRTREFSKPAYSFYFAHVVEIRSSLPELLKGSDSIRATDVDDNLSAELAILTRSCTISNGFA